MKFNLIYADPPWQYRDKGNDGERGACHKYQVMNLQDICRLPVWELADPDSCLLAMWWVPPMPAEALKVVDAWGFRLMTMKGFTWHKTHAKSGKDCMGMGNWPTACWVSPSARCAWNTTTTSPPSSLRLRATTPGCCGVIRWAI